MKNYIKVDSYRVVRSGSFWIAVFGVFFVNLLGRMQQTFSLDVFTAQYYSNMYSLFILSFAFGSLAYANSLVEDAECKSWYLQIQRGSLKGYVRSKVLICFFSDIPFMQRDEMYCLARLGRKKWGYSNLIVIACSGVILSLLLFLLSILQVLPVGRLQNDWGSVFHSFAVWKNDLALGLEINYAAMYAYTPFQLAVRVLIVDALAFTFLGMLLYTVSLCFSRMAAYAAAVIVVFLPSIIAKFPQYSLLSYSPFSWIEPANWRYEGNLDCPDMVYICIGFLLLIFLLAVVAQGRIKKVDWKEKENQH